MTAETANLCIWLSVALVLIAAVLVGMYCRWKKTLVDLEEECRKNEVLKEYAYKLELYIDVIREQRDEALENYDKLSHSWPFTTPKISEEEHQKLVDGFWKKEQEATK